MHADEPLGLVLDEERLRRAINKLGIKTNEACGDWERESQRLAELYLVDQGPTPRLTRPLELALTVLALMGLYGEKPGESFGYEGACRRVFGEVGTAWLLFGGDHSAWYVIGEAKSYRLLKISPSFEEAELAFNQVMGHRAHTTSTHSVSSTTTAVGPNGMTANLSQQIRNNDTRVSFVAVPNGAKAKVNARTETGAQKSYLLEIEVNPVGRGVGGRAWKQPIEKSAATLLAENLSKLYGAYQVESCCDDSNGNPDVIIQFAHRKVLVQHTAFEPQELRVALTRNSHAYFTYTEKDLRMWLVKRLESKRQDAKSDRTLILDAGFCIPTSPTLMDAARQLAEEEAGDWGDIWILIRLDSELQRLR